MSETIKIETAHDLVSENHRTRRWVDHPPEGHAPVPVSIFIGRAAATVIVGPGVDLMASAVELLTTVHKKHMHVAPNGIYPDGLPTPLPK